MSVEIHREAPGIYRAQWLGAVKIEEVIREMRTISSFANNDEVDTYVTLVDLRDMIRLPFDVGNLRRVALSDERCIAFIVVQASHGAQLLGQMLDKLTERDFRFVDDLPRGLQVARSLLASESHA
jgi:hypothetical protein